LRFSLRSGSGLPSRAGFSGSDVVEGTTWGSQRVASSCLLHETSNDAAKLPNRNKVG